MLADGGDQCGARAQRSLIHLSVKAYRWTDSGLVEKWTYASDWKPAPYDITDWEPPMQPAVAGDFIWIPGAGGTLDQVDRATGQRKQRIDPFKDARWFAVSGVTASRRGELYYAAFGLDAQLAQVGAALVKVSYDGTFVGAPWEGLVPPPGTACHGVFHQPPDRLPFPAVDDAGVQRPPPSVRCGPQRPQVTAVPALSEDSETIYFVSRDHFSSRYGFVAAAATKDLKPKWSASLRDRLDDGCGVTNPSVAVALLDGGDDFRCRAGATLGVDPATNEPPAARVVDSSSSSPMVLPDGTVLYGALTSYNTDRGHLLHFDAAGGYLGAYDFGWDVTPAAFAHDGTYSIVIKDNHYFEWDGDAGTFFMTRLNPALKPEWRFQNTNTMTCHDDGGCTADHPSGFEWCINAPAIDSNGSVYANAEDGNLYVIGNDGKLVAQKFLELAIGAAYTPLALDAKGRIYALNGGELFVFGQ
jgi:hypothetical protein